MTHPESIIVRWVPDHGAPHRLVFEPRIDGYYRREQVYTGDPRRWMEIGCEIVDRVAVEGPMSTVASE